MGRYRSLSTIPYVSNVSHDNPILAVGICKGILMTICCGTVLLRTFLFIVNVPILPLAVCYYKVHTNSFKFLFPRISPLREMETLCIVVFLYNFALRPSIPWLFFNTKSTLPNTPTYIMVYGIQTTPSTKLCHLYTSEENFLGAITKTLISPTILCFLRSVGLKFQYK